MPAESESEKLVGGNLDGWGSIKAVVNAPLGPIPADDSWMSVLGMWIFLPLNLLQGVIAGLVKTVFVQISLGCCCCPGSMSSVLLGRPCYLAYTWWRYVFAGLTALMAQGKSRLALFIWEWEAFHKAKYWWHGEGVWCWSYDMCDSILRSNQERHAAFGAIMACVPDLFATNILIFLSNSGSESEWAALRRALHTSFLDFGLDQYRNRVKDLPKKIQDDWQSPGVEGLNDTPRLQRTVCKCIMYMMFGVWITEAEATTLTGWRTNALFFILPRLVQRFAFNIGINRVKKLREETVGIIEKYNLEDVFFKMNASLPAKYRRNPTVKLCDEIMYVIGFAGIGGTCAGCESVACFLQNKIPPESAADHIKWGQYDTPAKMFSKYQADPDKFIKETCRMDPPVTSATAVLKEATKVSLAGKEYDMPAGILNQYVLSMANRDTTVFQDPAIFNPDRPTLSKAFTWNGAFGAADEDAYPRICPGRHLSLDVVKAIINNATGHKSELGIHKGPSGP